MPIRARFHGSAGLGLCIAVFGIFHLLDASGQNGDIAVERVPPLRKRVTIFRPANLAKLDPAVAGNWHAPLHLPNHATKDLDEGDVDPNFHQERQAFDIGSTQSHLYTLNINQPALVVVRAQISGASTFPTVTLLQNGKAIGSSTSIGLPPNRAEVTASANALAGSIEIKVTNIAHRAISANLSILECPQRESTEGR